MTKADKARFDAFRKIGCVACRMVGTYSLYDVHHTLSGGRRRGHQFTIPLCPWHHRGVIPEGYTAKRLRGIYGPSLALNPRAFRSEFGDDESLLKYTELRLQCLR